MQTNTLGRHTIRTVLVLAIISILGILSAQIYWLSILLDIKEKQFNQSMYIALRNVAIRIASFNKSSLVSPNPVNQISSDYFVVNTDSKIDANILEYYLKSEFAERELFVDFEYGIYNCESDKMVYGNYVSFDNNRKASRISTDLPKWSEYSYYFGVRIPSRVSYISNQMGIWIFMTLILAVVVLFFGYTIFVILKQRRLSEVQKSFINNMTHEFKTPISTIAISAEVLLQPQILSNPQRLTNYANIIKSENMRLKSQVEKVLQMAKIEKEKLALKKEDFLLNELLEEISLNMTPKIKEVNGSLELDIAPTQDLILNADRIHLTNVFYNLIDNALKYTERPPEIKITAVRKEKWLHIAVEDNGIGIAKEHQKKVFDQFYRVPTGDVHDVKGFGLGLNYVSLVAKAHRWRLSVESELLKGSIFSVSIPLRQTHQVAHQPSTK
ncbi:MAG: sensor histidine kinase [Cytophagales bacterium]|nr:MAG: sensor histidine kinase [Cytophagales bacterium]TAF60648.1 MAG: sensor histidine kinase [Cytophagales bacterium]